MIDQLRSELIKIRTVRSTVVMLGIVVLLSLVPAALIALLVPTRSLLDMDPVERVQVSLIGVQFSQILLAVIAALVIAGEFRFRTIRTTYLAEPRRLRVLAAKLLTVVLLAAVVAAVMVAVSASVTGLILNARGVSYSATADGAARILYGTVLYSILYAVTALAVATLVRNAAASIVLIIVLPLIVENIVTAIFTAVKHESWAKWLPFAAGREIASDPNGRSVFSRMAPWSGYAYGWGWALVLLAGGAYLLQRRDA